MAGHGGTFDNYTIAKTWKIERARKAFKFRNEICVTLPDGSDAWIEGLGGSGEYWDAWLDPSDPDVFFVTRIHRSLPYVALEEYARPKSEWERWERVADRCLFEQEWRADELVGSMDLQPCTIVRRLFEFAHATLY